MKNLFTTDYPTEVNGWFITDDDCLQYCKKDIYDKKGGTYQFVQYIQYDENNYTIVTDTIDIYDYIGVHDNLAYEYIIQILGSYGYGVNIIRGDMDDEHWSKILLNEFKQQNGDDWKRIFAECVFETIIFSADEIDTGLSLGQMYLALSNFLQTN